VAPKAERVDPVVGLAAYLEAAHALTNIGAAFEPTDWGRPSACPDWDASMLIGHVVCVVRWHHAWLDRAQNGEVSLPWPTAELPARNQAALDHLEIVGGASRLSSFHSATRRYADRVATHWDLPYAYPGGVVTAGVHALLAAGEWHLHAWDLARAIDVEHKPNCALIRHQWVVLGRSIQTDGDPWTALLKASGRIRR
jgi:hypothetical protein